MRKSSVAHPSFEDAPTPHPRAVDGDALDQEQNLDCGVVDDDDTKSEADSELLGQSIPCSQISHEIQNERDKSTSRAESASEQNLVAENRTFVEAEG